MLLILSLPRLPDILNKKKLNELKPEQAEIIHS